MPELPDLLYIKKYLKDRVQGRTITAVAIKQPVVMRVAIDHPLDTALASTRIERVDIHGPFLRFDLTGSIDVVINLMLAGKLQHQMHGEKPEGFLCCAFPLDDGSKLNLCDQEKMAKLYVVPHGHYEFIPKYREQGIDILSDAFTPDTFTTIARRNSRKQVRAFINDQTQLSSIGNAYADEILFEACIHPKTFVAKLSADDLARLHSSIRAVMEWGMREVENASQPIHVKVRDHMKVRNRKGEPCPRCGTTIRREGVRGHDVFFCPTCQPASRKLFIDWRRTSAQEPERS